MLDSWRVRMKVYVDSCKTYLGLIDLNGDLGRIFGGLAWVLANQMLFWSPTNLNDSQCQAKKTEVVKALAEGFFEAYDIQPNVNLFVKRQSWTCRPRFWNTVSSGSRRSSRKLSKCENINTRTRQIWMHGRTENRRGDRNFEQGGLVVDGGKIVKNGSCLQVPTLILRKSFPEQWRFVVAVPSISKGLARDEEKLAFKQLPQMRLKMLANMSPNNNAASPSVNRNWHQSLRCFNSYSNGRWRKTSLTFKEEDISAPLLLRVWSYAKPRAYGVGQSSWGPAFYGLFKRRSEGSPSKCSSLPRKRLSRRRFHCQTKQ